MKLSQTQIKKLEAAFPSKIARADVPRCRYCGSCRSVKWSPIDAGRHILPLCAACDEDEHEAQGPDEGYGY